MTPSAVFSRVLCADLSAAQLLSHLNALPYVVCVNYPEATLIGCFADKYVYQQQQQWHYIHSDVHTISIEQPADAELYAWLQPTHANDKVMGLLSYDHGANQQVELKKEKAQPSVFLACFQGYLSYQQQQWHFYSSSADAQQQFDYLQQQLRIVPALQLQLTSACQARWNKEQYQHAFTRIQDYIRAGDCYQINLTQEFNAQAKGQLLAAAEDFWQLTHAPYSGYLRCGEFELLSCSPELFIDFQAERRIVTKPIKGTMPRYADALLDQQSKETLRNSEKDQAENLMIVDLLRNDFGMFAETGSVKTPKLFAIESFNQVHHMVSEISAIRQAQISPFTLLQHSLPGGSITGAPKIRAMQIIDELEGNARGAYCGSLGYFNADGTGAWNILIRSIQKYQNEVSVWAGGGITIASTLDAEYQECFDKVAALLDLLNQYQRKDPLI